MIGGDSSISNKSVADSQSELKSSMDDDVGIQLGTPDRVLEPSEEESVSRFIVNAVD
jgi:hypothetical protein